ncbi:glycosyltransferase family 4 protein [Vibrio sp. FNV 38]|nr:glycosyltransferase family 4 protein [Vibrio sp. FNV 38]
MKTANEQHIIVFDPIPFHGGSKVATMHAMQQVQGQVHFHVLSAHPQSWKISSSLLNAEQTFTVSCLPVFHWIAKQTQGGAYWIKQAYLLMMLFIYSVALYSRYLCRPNKIILASGPGVDFSGYVLAHLLKLDAIQLVHGPVGKSRAARWCLSQGHQTFYLESAKPTLMQTLGAKFGELPKHFHPFVNGIPQNLWPTHREEDKQWHQPSVFWAASLLKWKGLDLLIDSLQLNSLSQRVHTSVCYIKPEKTTAEVSQAPVALNNTHWHEAPNDLDQIRANSDIYISTSLYEPFGLSTLEALAAGLIVIIPADGAYWDHKLQHGYSCFKYCMNDADSLNKIIDFVGQNLNHYRQVAKNGQKIATQYKASETYRDIANAIECGDSVKRMHNLGDNR